MMDAYNFYRVEHWLYKKKLTIIAKFIRAIIFLLFNSFIPYTCEIGKGTSFAYKGISVVIHSRAVIGKNCIIGSCVTIGGTSHKQEVPIIGDHCYIASGAKIIGPVKIGSNVVIGVNAVVLEDVPDNCVVAGVPAKIIKSDIDISDYM